MVLSEAAGQASQSQTQTLQSSVLDDHGARSKASSRLLFPLQSPPEAFPETRLALRSQSTNERASGCADEAPGCAIHTLVRARDSIAMNSLPPPPPPRSPGSANSGSFPHRHVPLQSITTSLSGGGQYPSASSPYTSYTPTANSPYASASYSPSSYPTGAHTESPRTLRSPSTSMEYNPQQWTSQPTGIQFRTRGLGSSLTIPTSRALDDSGRE
jgi:hypothetical protein